MWENDITKVGVGVELLGVVNLGWVYVWQKLMIDKGYFSEVYLCRPTLVMSFFGNTGCFPSPGCWECGNTFTKGNLCPDFG